MNEHSTGGPLKLSDLAQRPLPGTRVPTDFAFSHNGAKLYYLEPDESGDLNLVSLDCNTLQIDIVVETSSTQGGPITKEEELRRERLRLTSGGVSGFTLVSSPTRDLLLVNSRGHYTLIDGHNPTPPLLEFQLEMKQFAFSADTSTLAATTGTALHIFDLDTTAVSIFACDRWSDRGPAFSVGVAEYVAQEELDRLDGLWVSQNGRNVLCTEVDESKIPMTVIPRVGRAATDLESYRYPYAGGENASVTLSLLRVETGEIIQIPSVLDARALDEEHYLVTVVPTQDDNFLFATLDRGQRILSWWAVDASAATVTALFHEEGDPWINVPPSTLAISPHEIFTISERSDIPQIFHLSRGRDPQQLTHAEDPVLKILNFNQSSSLLYYLCATDRSRNRVVRALDLVNLTTTDLVSSDGWNDAVIAQGSDTMAFLHSSLNESPSVALRTLSGGVIAELTPPSFDPSSLSLTPPQLSTIVCEDGTELNMALYLPPRHGDRDSTESSTKAPIIVSVYGGPHAQMVTNSWAMTIDLQAQLLAQCGAIVVKLDNRGSFARGRSFEAPIDRSFGTIELEDQRRGVETVAREFGGDRTKVGIYGWSYGGFMTLTAMAKAPEIFRVGVSGAPVVDFRYYDTAYTERYLGRPEIDPKPYDQASILNFLDTLSGDLLVIHGLIDENVHFHHTAHLVEEMIKLGRPPELFILPDSRHAPRGQHYLYAIAERRTMHFVKAFSLASPLP
jgi:dipeptidyl-peptidase-4